MDALRGLTALRWKQVEAYRNSVILLLAFLAIYSCVEIALNLNRPYWGDETHFIETVRTFGQGVDLNLIKHYREMSTPLPFVMYAAWGKIVGFQTQSLRILSVLVAVLTYFSFHNLLFATLQDGRTALLATIFLALNPYMLAFSIFVFTDMLAILFLILTCIAIRNQNSTLLMISLTGALLCRQYLAFLSLAAGVYYFFRFWEKRHPKELWMLLAVGISCLPLLALFWLWQGFSPNNTLVYLYREELFSFHMNSVTLYVTQFFVYLFPLIVVFWKYFYPSMSSLAMPFVLSWSYFLFPILPSKVSVDMDIMTAGIFHRLVRFIMGPQFEHLVFYTLFVFGIGIVISLIKDTCERLTRRDFSPTLFFCFSLLAFLIVMPFSYLGWEKYFLPAVPIAMLWILSKFNEPSSNQGKQ